MVESPVAETCAAPARDSNGREHGHWAYGPPDRMSQRPGASHPSSVPPGSLEALQARKHRDASAAPSLVQGVQHLDVERPLGDDLGVDRVAECLDGRQTVAPSSLRGKPSRTLEVLSVRARLRRKGDRGNGRLRRRAPEKDNRPLLAFWGGGPGEFGSNKRERLKHRSGPQPPKDLTRFRLNAGLVLKEALRGSVYTGSWVGKRVWGERTGKRDGAGSEGNREGGVEGLGDQNWGWW